MLWEGGFSSFAHNGEMLREFAACGSRGHPSAAAWQAVSPCCEVYSGCVSTDRARSWDWKPSRPEEQQRAFKSTLESVGKRRADWMWGKVQGSRVRRVVMENRRTITGMAHEWGVVLGAVLVHSPYLYQAS